MSSDYAIRLRRVIDPAAGTVGGVIPCTDGGEPSFTAGATVQLSFSVSTHVAGTLQQPFYVRVEQRTDTGWVVPDFDLFTVYEDASEDADNTGSVNFTGVSYVLDRLATALVDNGLVDGDLTFTEASAGGVMGYLLAQDDIGVTATFTPTKDSNGVDWPTVDIADQTFQQHTNLRQVLDTLTSGAFCDWSTRGTELVLTVAGSGVDLSGSVKIGRDARSVAVKTSTADTATDFDVVYDTGIAHVTRPQIGLGKRRAVVTVAGATDEATALRLATPFIDAAAAPKREVTVLYDAPKLPARPFVDFHIGDQLLVKSRGSWEPRRVVSVQVNQGTPASVRLVFGEMFLPTDVKIAQRIGQIAIGQAGTTGGSGKAVTSPPIGAPAAPAGLAAVSNVGEWARTGDPVATVVLDWADVTQTVDGAATVIDEYAVYASAPGGDPVLLRTTTASTVTVQITEVTEFVVTAHNHRWGDFSAPISVTPAAPADTLGKPGAFALSSALGTVYAPWDGLLAGTVPPNNFRAVRAQTAESSTGPWTTAGVELRAAGVVNLSGPVGDTMWVRFVPVTTSGTLLTASASDPASIVVQGVTGPDLEANSVTTNALEAGSVTADKIAAGVGGQLDLTGNAIVISAGQTAQQALDTAQGKADILYQDQTPGVLAQKASTAWIDTTDGGNVLKRWVGDGTPNASESHLVDATGTEWVNRLTDPSFELGVPAGATQSAEWAVDGSWSLAVDTGFVTLVDLTDQTLVITPRTAGQVARLDTVDYTAAADEEPIRITGTGTVTLGAGWWDLAAVVDGTYDGPAFTGDTDGAWWGDGAWVPVPDASIQEALDTATAASQTSQDAHDTATAAQGAADAAKTATDGLLLVIRAEPDALKVTRPGSNNAVWIDDDSVDLLTGSQVGASLTAGRLTVPEILVQGGVIGNHSVSVEAGQTIFRSL